MLRLLSLFLMSTGIAHMAFGQFGDCLYQHELEQPTELIHEVKLPPTAFAKTNGDLYNFRVYGVAASGDTLEMPWAYPGHTMMIFPKRLKRLNAGKVNGADRFTFQVAYRELISSLELGIKNKDFEGIVTLEGANKLGDWQVVFNNYRIIDLSKNGGPYRLTTLKFKPSLYTYYRITVRGVDDLVLEYVEHSLKPVFQYDTLSLESKWQKARPTTERSKTNIYEIVLPEEILVDNVILNIADTLRYVRQVEIQSLQDSFMQGDEMKYRYRTIANTSVSSLDSNEPIGFEPLVAHQLRVLIRNRDNQPLTVTNIEAGVKEPRINVRFSDAESYYLAYGCKSLTRPDYDNLEELGPISERPTALALAPLNSFVVQSPTESVEGLFSNPLWLYGALVLVAGLLGWMAIGMMRK